MTSWGFLEFWILNDQDSHIVHYPPCMNILHVYILYVVYILKSLINGLKVTCLKLFITFLSVISLWPCWLKVSDSDLYGIMVAGTLCWQNVITYTKRITNDAILTYNVRVWPLKMISPTYYVHVFILPHKMVHKTSKLPY